MGLPQIKSDSPKFAERHLPGQIYLLGSDATWLKECLPTSVNSKKLKALDAQALRLTFTLTQKVSPENAEVLIDVSNIVVDLREGTEEEPQPHLAVIRRSWPKDVFRALRIICMTMTIDEKCKVEIPTHTVDLQLTHPWTFVIYLHDHFQAYWPWPMPPRPNPPKVPASIQDTLIFESIETQERVLKELSEAQVKAEAPWWGLRDTIVAFVSQHTVVSSWKPARFSHVWVHYTLKCADTGEVIWDTRQNESPHSFTVGCGDVIPALSLAVRQNYALNQEGFIIAKPAAAFGPYDHSLEAAKVFHKRFLDGFSFHNAYQSVLDTETDGRFDRERPTKHERTGLVEDPNPLDDHEEDTERECDPNFLLLPSSLDMSAWIAKYQGRHILIENFKLLEIRRLPNELNFQAEEDRVRFARRWKEIAVRFWRIQDYVRAYQCFYQASFILEPFSHRVISVGPEPDDNCKTLRNKCIINSAVCLGKLEDWDELKKVLAPVLQRDPDNEKAIYWMACVNFAKGDETTAASYCTRLINLNPQNIDARKLLSKIREKSRTKGGAFTSTFIHHESLQQAQPDVRDTPAPDWSEVEAAGYNPELLRSWGLCPTRTIDDDPLPAANDYELDVSTGISDA